MEKQFPAKQMNAWLKQFWLHPDKVENYTNKGYQLNTMIGIAEIDVSSWFSGATGAVIGKVLTNYIFLLYMILAFHSELWYDCKLKDARKRGWILSELEWYADIR